MSIEATMIERAYDLAKSGSVANLDFLIRALKREGFDLVEAHLRCSPMLSRQLRTMCKSAWVAAGNQPVRERRPI